MKTFFILFIFAFFTHANFAQKSAPKSISSIQAQIQKNGDAYIAKYDEFKNQSVVSSRPAKFDVDLPSNIKANPTIIFGFEFSGKILKSLPPVYLIGIFSKTVDVTGFRYTDLNILADGKRIPLGRGAANSDYQNSEFTEFLFYTVKAKDFAVLARSNEIRLKIGENEGNLLQPNILAIQKIYKLSR